MTFLRTFHQRNRTHTAEDGLEHLWISSCDFAELSSVDEAFVKEKSMSSKCMVKKTVNDECMAKLMVLATVTVI